MEKTFNGYYRVGETCEYDGTANYLYYFKVQNNKITNASFIHTEDAGQVNNELKKVIGEDFKDFIIEKMFDNNYNSSDNKWSAEEMTDDERKEYKYYKDENRKTLGISEQDYQKQIDSILQSKENKAILGKTDVMDKITELKNGRNGK